MQEVFKCLKTKDGVIALLPIDSNKAEELKRLTTDEIDLGFTEKGVVLRIKDVVMPIPIELLNWMAELEECYVSIYPIDNEYISEHIITIELNKTALIKANGAYNFWKKEVN